MVTCKPCLQPAAKPLWVLDLGRQPYLRAWELQRKLLRARTRAGIPDVLLFAEHEPVFTQGRHGDRGNLLVSREVLRSHGVPCLPTDRGGDITFHGPGQLVGYPILKLPGQGRQVKRYVRILEEILLQTLDRFDIAGRRETGKVGVWVGPAKIASIGLALSQGVSYHGFALNVDMDLSPFSWIRPCGLRNTPVTSMALLLDARIPLTEVREALTAVFAAHLGYLPVRRDLDYILELDA